jgi:GNAT superfamily N-acetyltransferase
LTEAITIRPMTEADGAHVRRVLLASYRWLGSQERWTPEQLEEIQSWRASLESIRSESQRQAWLVASIYDQIVGVAAVDGNELAKLYVVREHQGIGIGTRLFREAERVIRSAGHPDMVLGTTNTGRPFYEAMGMTVTGTRPYGVESLADRDVIIMSKSLAGDDSARTSG